MQAFAVLFNEHRYAKALLSVALMKNPALLNTPPPKKKKRLKRGGGHPPKKMEGRGVTRNILVHVELTRCFITK